mmetsp:Transcript_7503/g.16237  ORF Transcript_7503/g.16237 Transcript_7503/m.16237 type:complete len:233 (-) Transcript_7503:192-890(-)
MSRCSPSSRMWSARGWDSGTSSSRYAPTSRRDGISASKAILLIRSSVAVSLHCKSSMNSTAPFRLEQMTFKSLLMANCRRMAASFPPNARLSRACGEISSIGKRSSQPVIARARSILSSSSNSNIILNFICSTRSFTIRYFVSEDMASKKADNGSAVRFRSNLPPANAIPILSAGFLRPCMTRAVLPVPDSPLTNNNSGRFFVVTSVAPLSVLPSFSSRSLVFKNFISSSLP